jgi:hypothetical protein
MEEMRNSYKIAAGSCESGKEALASLSIGVTLIISRRKPLYEVQ